MASVRKTIKTEIDDEANKSNHVLMTTAIINEVLQCLPASEVAVASRVCKTWKTAFSSEALWQFLLKRDERSFIHSDTFLSAKHGSKFLYYSQDKLMVAKIRNDAIRTLNRTLFEYNFLRFTRAELISNFIDMPDNYFIAYSKKLIPAELVTGITPDNRMSQRAITFLENNNLARLKRVFEGHALILLEDTSLQQSDLRNVVYHLGISTGESQWVNRYEQAFLCLELGRQVFLNDENRKVFDLIPDRAIPKLNGKLFAEILLEINKGHQPAAVITKMCSYVKSKLPTESVGNSVINLYKTNLN